MIRGRTRVLRTDSGPEFIGEALAVLGPKRHRVEIRLIQPGKPMQNGYVERFKRRYRAEVLNCYVFETLGEVRQMTAEWITHYNEQSTHDSPGNFSLRDYLIANSTQLLYFKVVLINERITL